MPRRTAIPPSIAPHFSYTEARAAGVSNGRLRGPDVSHPFHGVHSIATPTTPAERARALSKRMAGAWAFSHTTAASLYRIPVPSRFEGAAVPLHVVVPMPRRGLRTHGVIGHHVKPESIEVRMAESLPVVSPEDTWFQLATILDFDDLVAAGDYLISGDPADDERRIPLSSPEQLADAAQRHRGRRGMTTAAAALEQLRTRVDSRPESRLRLVIVHAGLPEPAIHPEIVTEDLGTVHPDLGYPELMTAIEFDGDGHRERKQWLRDMRRYAAMEAEGWVVVKATADDVFKNPVAFVGRLRRTIALRGPREAVSSPLARRERG